MVNSQDERAFIMPAAGWCSVAGLVFSLIGVLLLFRYGMPYQLRTGGSSIYVASSSDPRSAALEQRYSKLGWLGLFLIVIGTICQIVGVYLSNS
jgi:hypothetical protein